jgi:hypothetical protein
LIFDEGLCKGNSFMSKQWILSQMTVPHLPIFRHLPHLSA